MLRLAKHGLSTVAAVLALTFVSTPLPIESDVVLGLTVALAAFIGFLAGYMSRDTEGEAS